MKEEPVTVFSPSYVNECISTGNLYLEGVITTVFPKEVIQATLGSIFVARLEAFTGVTSGPLALSREALETCLNEVAKFVIGMNSNIADRLMDSARFLMMEHYDPDVPEAVYTDEDEDSLDDDSEADYDEGDCSEYEY